MPRKPTREDLEKTIRELQEELAALKQAHETLKESELRSRAVFDHTFQFIGLMTPDGVLVDANRTALDFGGVKVSEVLGRPFWETPWWRHSTELQERLRRGVQRAAAGEFVRFEATHPAQDGRLEYIDFSLKPVKDETGKVTFLIPEGRNITDYKRAEEALKESEERYRDLFENASDLIQAVTPDGRFLYVNRAWSDTLGYTPEEAGGLRMFDVIHPDSLPHCEDMFGRIMTGEKIGKVEAAFVSNKGEKIFVEGSINCRFEEGRPVSTRGIFRDITDRKRIEEALRVSEERFRGIAAAAHDAIISVDNEGVITFWNLAAARIFGHSQEEAIGRDVHRLLAPARYVPACRKGFDAWRETGRGPAIGQTTELSAIGKDGTEFPIELSLSSVMIGGRWNAIALVRDISGRKRVELELEKRTLALDMRVRHLRCLYAISQLLEEGQKSLAEILPGIADRMSTAWQYPEITAVRIVVEDREYSTADFRETPWRLAREIMVSGAPAGVLEVYYLEEKPAADEGPFLREERTLLNVICERTGKVIERIRAEEELTRARRQEVEIAARIQRMLLLGKPPTGLPGIEFASLAIPSQGIDGDFYDFFAHSPECVDVIIGDVMGKGVRAALLGAGAKSHFFRAMTSLIPSLDHFPEPREIVQWAHDRVAEELIRLESFLTVCYARFDLKSASLDFVDCGHPRTIHFHRATGTCTTLEGQNMPMGFSPEEKYLQEHVSFEPGDVFFFYSDAVTETQNDAGEFFEEERLVRCVCENGHLSPRDLINRVLSAVVSFSHSEAFGDDLTCIAVKIREDEENV